MTHRRHIQLHQAAPALASPSATAPSAVAASIAFRRAGRSLGRTNGPRGIGTDCGEADPDGLPVAAAAAAEVAAAAEAGMPAAPRRVLDKKENISWTLRSPPPPRVDAVPKKIHEGRKNYSGFPERRRDSAADRRSSGTNHVTDRRRVCATSTTLLSRARRENV
mmetsp:Transcript_38712/g.62029  ORF Transcript_38712/g.62029 Transcript_38712/m.62029 type:complete len:164 (+) Transcript_38712:1896-2387(+)